MAEERLDVRLAAAIGVTRSRAGRLIRDGCVTVNGVSVRKPGAQTAEGDVLRANVPPPEALTARPEAIPLEILYEDAHMAVVVKPEGMVVHPAAGHGEGTLVSALLYHLRDLSGIGGTLRPGIVHRLDKDTSGLMLVAKDDAAHLGLSRALGERRIQKTYQAVVQGGFREDSGVIESPIARHPKDRKRMAVVPGGREARTEWQVREAFSGATLLQVRIITGRTHQIRVHMASIGHPVLGDVLYGGKGAREAAPRLMLHAWRLSLVHPVTGEPLSFEAPPPDSFARALQKRRR